MKALIDPNTPVFHIIGWTDTKPSQPSSEFYPNSARVCQVNEIAFEVAAPQFWVDCSEEVVADAYWYDMEAKEIKLVEITPPIPTTIL